MARIEFYEVEGSRRLHAACRHAETACEAGERVYVWVDSEEAARELDELLWTFRDDSFVPHEVWSGGAPLDVPVAVGWAAGNPNGASCVVLLREAAAAEVSAFLRAVDFVPAEEGPAKVAARRRYRACQGAGHEVAFRRPA